MVHGQPNHALVDDLRPESTFLDTLHRNFCNHFTFADSEIISFWETKQSQTARVGGPRCLSQEYLYRC